MGNSLLRGTQPFADAELTKVLLAPRIHGHMTATELQGVLPISHRSPIAGRVRKLEIVVRVLTAGAGLVGLDANGTILGANIVIPTASPAGTLFSDTYVDDVDNLVAVGDLLEVTTDGVPTAGELTYVITIEPSP